MTKELQSNSSTLSCSSFPVWSLQMIAHSNWNRIFVLHINTTTAYDIQDILFSFLYSCYINSCHLSFLSQYSSNIWTVNTSTYNFSILISDLGCHKLWWYLCVKQKSSINCRARCFSIRTYLSDWDLNTFTSSVDRRIFEDDDWSNSKTDVSLAICSR